MAEWLIEQGIGESRAILVGEGEIVEAQGYVFEILDMDGHRVDKVLVMPAKTPGSDRAAK